MGILGWTAVWVVITFSIYIGIAVWSRVADTKGFYVAGQGVPAVANGRIHRFKGTYMGWDPATGLIDLMHMAKILFPRAMADVDVAQRGERILRFFYGEQGLYAHLARQSGLELRTRP
mgnify:CR=1 FL=1